MPNVQLGLNAGFLRHAPVEIATGGVEGRGSDGNATGVRHVAPVGAVRVTEIGWHAANPQDVDWEAGLYANDDLNDVPAALIGTVSASGRTDQGTGWYRVAVDIGITPGLVYWIAVQQDGHAGGTIVAGMPVSGQRLVQLEAAALADPFGAATAENEILLAIYALCEFKANTRRKLKINHTPFRARGRS